MTQRTDALSGAGKWGLNDLLQKHGIAPEQALVFRHTPIEPELNKVLPWLASERPDLFNAYQQTQTEKVENAMKKAKYVASFIAQESDTALFVGLYAVGGWRPLSHEQFWRVPAYAEMKEKFGLMGFSNKRKSVLWFDLKPCDFYRDWKGKLIVRWPPPAVSWWRWADRNEMPVTAIVEESLLVKCMPQWEEIGLTWNQLENLPNSWKSKLSEWRGVYYIFDESDGKGYVGAAYGRNNLLGRWLNYKESGHGGNKLLRKRVPTNFRFSILELLAPSAPPEVVIRRENTWKERLHTRSPHGLNEN